MTNSHTSGTTANDRHISYILKKARILSDFDTVQDLRPEQMTVLGGGNNAAVYLIRSPEKQIIIKLDDQGVEAETEAIEQWRKRGARVPDVLAAGKFPESLVKRKNLKYIIQKALLTKHGILAETCANYLAHSPDNARTIGRLMGAELTKIHRAVSDRSFGDYGDVSANTAAFKTWNAYLLSYLEHQKKYLKKLGVRDEDVIAVADYIKNCKFVSHGRYLHGDFSIRNAAIKSFEPLKISLFDPNPLIGDPTWDIAVPYNNYEFAKHRYEIDERGKDIYDRDKQLLIGFKQGYARRIKMDALLPARLIQAVLQAQATEDKVARRKMDKEDFQARKDVIHNLVEYMAKGEKHG